MCLFLAHLFSFMMTSLYFPMFSSLTSLAKQRIQRAKTGIQRDKTGMQRAEFENAKSIEGQRAEEE